MCNSNINNFLNQIKEDIEKIQEEYANGEPKLNKKSYAFNFWILQNIFGVDEEIIVNYITDYSDGGIDCWYFKEEEKELYLIQNKYFLAEGSKNSEKKIIDEFLDRALDHLDSPGYNKSIELKEIYEKYKNDKDFWIKLNYFSTEQNESDKIRPLFERWSSTTSRENVDAKYFGPQDIKESLYGEMANRTQKFELELRTIDKKTRIDIDPWRIDGNADSSLTKSQFMPVSVYDIFEMCKKAKEDGFDLFEENVRKYIGNNKVNSGIVKTLKDDNEMNYFLFYNNGIAITCDDLFTIYQKVLRPDVSGDNTNTRKFSESTNRTTIINPQIINGCQTVNSIYHALKTTPDSNIEKYKKVYVMTKILKISKDDKDSLFSNIVRYNNTQNAIKSKDFTLNEKIYKDLKTKFRKNGFFLDVRQSDKNEFNEMEKSDLSKYIEKSKKYFEALGIKQNNAKLQIKIEKLFQVILAFFKDGFEAYTKKSNILKSGSEVNEHLVSIISNNEMTIDKMLKLWMLFLKAEEDKKNSANSPQKLAPFYAINFAKHHYEKDGDTFFELNLLSNHYSLIKNEALTYVTLVKGNEQLEYNQMVKKPIYTKHFEMAIKLGNK